MQLATAYQHPMVLILCVWICFVSVTCAKKTCNVLDYGAKADKQTDIGPPLLKAYADCLKATTGRPEDTIVLIPQGDFSLKSNVLFAKGKGLTFTFNGQIHLAYNSRYTGNMIAFTRCQNLVVNGVGAFHGYGDLYRPGGNLNHLPQRPRLVRFENCQDVDYSGFNLFDAPLYHLVVALGTNFRIHNFRISSTNIGATDGIDVSGTNIHVHDVDIKTGDECVTAKSPMKGLLVERVSCINTDGCSIGSFGASGKGYIVEDVLYRHVNLTNASNGVVVKTYSSSQGTIRNITFTDFILDNVAYPIKFDYTWGETLHKTKRNIGSSYGSQKWTDAKFINFRGTGSKYRPLVTLHCSPRSPCTHFKFQNIQLQGSVEEPSISSACGTVDNLSRKVLKNSLPGC
ncbi:hypothetical protein PTTG_03469 [Puccinia triticina 1-1 BBBD Race 1]|uniref:Uncharacterized protein n=2 Tax=Puccinia triticina TaxID=208348 RepID=A0A180GVE4_PUCT1|nr:uncharacterized protein PtA15_7A767 [Puccinia triticina]OAV96262.1 hypothetical protein PTTG_03469 [Puccinia triticina 1-1 BBBD Race 1]WAQ87038.1 hypothetical protein PtA15_7A767 [Puccinia triticina]WAR56894.1 hypothetical protein PtB15_7B746 [Puccinia triticina]